MKKYLFIASFLTFIYCDMVPYISPGIQVGLNSNGNFFISAQITGGIFEGDLMNDEFLTCFGITAGTRLFFTDVGMDRYNYIDAQIGFPTVGVGIGLIGRNKAKVLNLETLRKETIVVNERYTKFKVWFGAIGLLSYDLISSPVGKHNFGLFGVAPFPIVE